MYRRLNKQRSIFTSSQALMKAIYLDYKKFEIGGAKSVKKKESDPYYISNDFSLIYFSCI